LKRYEPEAREGAASEQQLAGQQSAVAELQNTIKADQAGIDSAKAQLSYTSLVAPFDGITGIRLLDVGNVIQAATTSTPSALVVITQVEPISVIFTLPTTNILEVQDALARGHPEVIAFTLMIMVLTVCATVALFVWIPKGFFPQQDTGMIVGITEGAQDISPHAMMERQSAIIEVVTKDPAVASAIAYIGPGGATVTENDGRMFITLKPLGQRKATADQVIARLNQALHPVQGIRLYMQAAQDINVGARLSKTQYQYTLVDVDSDELNHYAPLLLQKLQELPQLADVASDQQSAGQTLDVEINRDVASRLGVDPSVIDSILYDAFGQRHVARIYTTLNQYYVILEVDPGYQLGPNALGRIYAKADSGAMVPLSQFANVRRSIAPLAINHQGQFPSVTLSFDLAANATIGDAVATIRKTATDLHMPLSITASFQGNAQAFQSSLSSTPILILAALVAVYLILGMLYESTIHPLTIISTLPSAGLGALLTLMLFGMPLDVIGIIGIILLIGIVKKNGIMLIDFALEGQRQRNLSSEDAIHEACRLRFRPILMTTLCALLAGVPLMLGTGIGSEIRQPLGYAMVGGLIVSQLLTLFTTPVVYIYMDRLNEWLSRPPSAKMVGTPEMTSERNLGSSGSAA
jgi:multidrug efflux pump subunit AcrB